ncbi:MAG: hypothetical protein HND44_23525 [Chloroflexi bacterium]|nr:hypothetical protein [Ardenticatenaceae bacterium]NOG37514.1 hypothetical protein [Chloroflexota bacterium]
MSQKRIARLLVIGFFLVISLFTMNMVREIAGLSKQAPPDSPQSELQPDVVQQGFSVKI